MQDPALCHKGGGRGRNGTPQDRRFFFAGVLAMMQE